MSPKPSQQERATRRQKRAQRLANVSAQIVGILERVPEGFIPLGVLRPHLKFTKAETADCVDPLIAEARVGRTDGLLFDAQRLNADQVHSRRAIFTGVVPSPAAMRAPPIAEQLAARAATLPGSPVLASFLERLGPHGHALRESVAVTPDEDAALQDFIRGGVLAAVDSLVYDPLRVGRASAAAIAEQMRLAPLRDRLLEFLAGRHGQAASREDFFAAVGDADAAQTLLNRTGAFVQFTVKPTVRRLGSDIRWIRRADAPAEAAERAARAALAAAGDHYWEACLPQAGETLRPGARDGTTARIRVVARSYSVAAAAKRLTLPLRVVQEAAEGKALASFVDPTGQTRLTAGGVEAAAAFEAEWEKVAAFVTLRTRDISLVSGLSYSTVRRRLEQAHLSRTEPRWGQVRGQWGLPKTLRLFREILEPRREAWLKQVLADRHPGYSPEETYTRARSFAPLTPEDRALERARRAETREAAQRQREELRQRLLTVFPAWDAAPRPGQKISLHLGPTNSGKTFEALNHLAEAGSGWYLAPLRLLAYEVFETLNQRGVLCNLRTGEESIQVPGARLTASTIEMFAPEHSGDCTVIDEAYLLADEQRGWAWTQALLETRSPDIQVVGAPIVGRLVQRLAEAAGLAVEVVEHARLTPLEVAPRPWTLNNLPSQTILVAFSRQTVLALKTELERSHHRTVSVVYGDLPPEVRHSQAARFAAGQTEVVVATDAVGMGLNLPARHVCFFEVEKFDGRTRRALTANEIRQIGGRAGRFGLSERGVVGALSKDDLRQVDTAFRVSPAEVTFARVAPTPQALALLPGTLAHKLSQWAELKSIPDNWRQMLQPVDVSEAVELARLLTPADVATLGEPAALRLINAPTDDNTRGYWLECARAILEATAMPLPAQAPAPIRNAADLQYAETCIRSADVYLWLSQRREFAAAGPDADLVRAARAHASQEVDAALQRKVDTARRCRSCGRPLPVSHRYGLCNKCYRNGLGSYDQDFDLD